jgi:putative transposase
MAKPIPTEEEIALWLEPQVAPDDAADYQRRKNALTTVIRGKSIAAAADTHGVNRKTLTKMLNDCMRVADDGREWQWRVCLPNRARVPKEVGIPAVPEGPRPGAFTQLLRAIPELTALLAGYTKALPTRERHSPAFEKFLEKFLAAIRKITQGVGYPFNAGDKGRRSVQTHIQKMRRELPVDESEEEQTELVHAKQLKEVFQFNVMERLEFDAHRMDADFVVEVEDANGIVALRQISYIWLLLVIDSASRLVLGWSLVIGRGYSQVDVLRVFMKALLPWEPRNLLAPDMEYVRESGIGTMPAVNRLLRGSLTAADNALAHHSKLTTSNLTTHFKGILSLGPSHVPETRGILESLFRKLENGAIRHLPGGFEPQRDRDTPKRSTTSGQAESHPLNLIALGDLLDVIISGYNATPLAALGDRTPMDVVRSHVNGGGWTFESPQSEKDAHHLARMRIPITIRANSKKRRQPFVNFKRARYRAHGLMDRWDLVGKTFQGIMNFEDLRYIDLYDENGDLYVRLTALPPWSRTKHDLDLRNLIIRWSNRKLFSIVGVDDAVDAYRNFVRSHVTSMPAAVDQTAKYQQHHSSRSAKPVRPTPAYVPRGGLFNFDNSKDPT